jgi:ABC-type amino acid transport substrate-binding protein
VAEQEQDLDVFISYSQSRRELTARLAAALEAEGFSTWWDTDLVAGDNFRDEINKRLEACKVAIIIWTPESAQSEWVRSEADHALRRKKLLNLHVPELKIDDIPKPFDQRHSVTIDDQAAIIRAVKQHVERSKSRTRTDYTASPRTLLPAKIEPPKLKPRRPWAVAGLLAVVLLAGLAVWAYWPASIVPQWAFDNKPFYLYEAIPLKWTYKLPDRSASVWFEVQSGTDGTYRFEYCTDADHYNAHNINATRQWMVRAVADCQTKAPISKWSQPIEVTQYEGVYQRIKARGYADIFVSNSQDQGMFKWGDHGFDIDLTRLILRDLSTLMGRELTLALKPVPWAELLPAADKGAADFAISSITRRPQREQEFRIQFSDSYYCTTHALVYRASMQEGRIRDMVKGKVVGVQRDSTNARLAEMLAVGSLFTIKAFDNTESLQNELITSRIDLAVTDTAFAQAAQLDTRLRNGGVDRLKFKEFEPDDMPPSMQGEQTQEYAIAVHKDEYLLLHAINEKLAKAKQDGELASLFRTAAENYEAHKQYPPGSLGPHSWECLRSR